MVSSSTILYKLPRCEFYSRFSNSFLMCDPKRWNTYHRSLFKRIEDEKQTKYTFKPEPSHKPDKSGSYYNPFHFYGYQQAVTLKSRATKRTQNDNHYDALLTFQHATAQYIATAIKTKNSAIKANADNGYPCVLVAFPKPDKSIKTTDWVHFCSLYFIAIANHLSEERGLNCELVRRSGFGHIRPSIAETAPSFRINVGFIPQAYADVLIDSTELVYQLLCINPKDLFGQALTLPQLSKDLTQYNHFNKRKGKRVNKSLSLKDTLWENLWNALDSQSHSFIYQVMRKEQNAEQVINILFEQLRELPISLNEALKEEARKKELFVSPWITIFRNYQLKDKRLSLTLVKDELQQYQWKKTPMAIEEDAFWEIIARLGAAYHQKMKKVAPEPTLDGLHERLEAASRSFFFRPDVTNYEDGYGSDSDCEESFEKPDHIKHVYAKKFITATGMRAIQLAFAAVKRYLGQETGLNYRNLGFYAENMYYETHEALSRHALSIDLSDINELSESLTITLFDLNHCNTEHLPPKKAEDAIRHAFPILILDTTSSTTALTGQTMKRLFSQYPHLTTIICVSSGLKNEQAGSDINPYGTLRIFSKCKSERDGIYRQCAFFEARDKYNHPAYSHLLRKNAKNNGMTPTNDRILAGMR